MKSTILFVMGLLLALLGAACSKETERVFVPTATSARILVEDVTGTDLDGGALDGGSVVSGNNGAVVTFYIRNTGGTTLAATIKLIEDGSIPRDESICVCITGNGLKTIEVQAGRLPSVPVIAARPEALAAVVEGAPEASASETPEAAAPGGGK